ncbi:MAG: hypothetical protein PHY73_06645 [Candidatus Omnitrophica bacterium]|nr:hypothetical protein [Candidatus Omnitrophota bacterium]
MNAKGVELNPYYLDNQDRFVIENYNNTKTFTNFFPGIAGAWGIPMWVFYVNRGQCVSSFGIESKDKSIMEFQPANKAYRHVSTQGFRTFLKIKSGNKTIFYEPFQENLSNCQFKRTQKMAISAHDLTIEEVNQTLGISVEVNYATLPEEQYAALIRKVSVKNLSKKKYDIEIIDGMPAIVPYGLNDRLLKDISRTVEAWIQVSNLKKKAAYYNLKVVVSDKSCVENITEGNFYFSFQENGKTPKLLDPIVQSACIFGKAKDFIYPKAFVDEKNFQVPKDQKTRNKTPSAMSFAKSSLKAGQKTVITSLIGHIHSKPELNRIVKKSIYGDYLDVKADRSRAVIDEIRNLVFTNSGSREFNLYSMQTFVDNVLRGGLPVSFKTEQGRVSFNVFSRKHGDPERDYNYFVLNPTFLSQGNGNYRDVNQNRRNDIWFNQDVKDTGIINFLNLSQADGYNPLVVRGTAFALSNSKLATSLVKKYVSSGNRKMVSDLLEKDFFPGEVLKVIFENDIKLTVRPREFLTTILSSCHIRELADHGEGFWTDHWTYNLDLIESYLNVYPENLKDLLADKKAFTFYHNDHYVLPRCRKYVLTERGPRQYQSVAKLSKDLVSKKDNKLRVHNGTGRVYHTNLIVKLLCLIVNKAASLDPSGIGVEMEADKPNWYDALNGLPGLFGSSISETLEVKRACLFLLNSLEEIKANDQDSVDIFEELASFLSKLSDALLKQTGSLSYWKKSNDIKEAYRHSVLMGITGKERAVSILKIKKFLNLVLKKIDKAIVLAKDEKGVLATYFSHELVDYKKLKQVNDQNLPFVAPLKFKRHALPPFLEGFVHALRSETSIQGAREYYKKVRASKLFDQKLKMYKVNADLSGESSEIGRTRIFPAGWLENESIWLHMEYKFLLELLRCGLYEEFYSNLRNTVVPFLDPKKYSRSILENSSFIVSSAHEDPKSHGRGYVARLSGSTAEFVHMWLFMNVGIKPFSLDKNGKLQLEFKPILDKSMFTTKPTTACFRDLSKKWCTISLPENTYAFNFIARTLVVYHNSERIDTFDQSKFKIKKIVLSFANDKKNIELESQIIPSPYAERIRNGECECIDVFF